MKLLTRILCNNFNKITQHERFYLKKELIEHLLEINIFLICKKICNQQTLSHLLLIKKKQQKMIKK